MQRIITSFFTLLVVGSILLPINASSQSLLPQVNNNAQEQETDSLETVINPIPLNEINSASTEAFTLYSRAGNSRLNEDARSALTSELDSLVSRTTAFFQDTVGLLQDGLSFREYEVLKNSLFLLLDNLTKFQEVINKRLNSIQGDINMLMESRSQWKLTLEGIDEENTPEAITRRIIGVINQGDSVSSLLQQDIDFLLTQSDKITSQQINIDQFKLKLEDFNTLSSEHFLQKDMPAIWAAFTLRDSTEKASLWQNFSSSLKDDTDMIVTKYTNRLILFVCLFIVLLIMVFWIRATMKDTDIRGKNLIMSLYLNEIFQKPVEVSILLGMYLLRLLIPDIPEIYSSFLSIIVVFALLRVAFEILPANYKTYLLEFAGAYVLLKFYNLFYDQHIFARLVLLVTQVITMLFLLHFVIKSSISKARKRTFIKYMLYGIGSIYIVLIFLALIGNVIGTLSISEFISSGVIQSTFLVLSTYVGFQVSAAFLFLLMSSAIFKRSNVFRKQFSYIFQKLYQILKLVFVVSWITISLSFFNFKEPFFKWCSTILNNEMHIGKAPFTLISIILFIFVIWLSMFIARIIRTILQEEVFTRVKVERGIPSTIIMLVRIALVSIGFLLAAAAAGMQLSSLTIIIGAFSVGIGFGLQNIFNNLVSGLILAFERPIKEGDMVEVNSLLGEVKKIGIRSSVVRTTDGAEVIVPNGTLISNELINWTLSDQHRRLDIRVGVAYGTDPEKVLDILTMVAKDQKHALNEPEATAYFIGFGDSSLDFRLLVWAEQEYRREVASDLNVRINAEIKKAGIEIPFPQRDLHVRSVDGKVIGDVKSKK